MDKKDLKKTGGSIRTQRKKQLIFFCLLLVIPVTQFCIFYVGVNFNSILLAFKSYTIEEGYKFVGFDNFVSVFSEIFDSANPNNIIIKYSLKNSLIMGSLSLFVGVVFSVIFSYYIFKNFFGSEVFKIFLFLPSMVSSVILIIIFKKFIDSAVPELILKVFGVKVTGLLSNANTQLGTIMAYTLFVGFGTQVMMYSGAMSGISPSIIEAGELDGCTPITEFIYLVVPLIFGTIQTFIVVTIATMFVNQIGLFSFYGPEANISNPKLTSIGYYLYKQVYSGQLTIMPRLAAFGICLTLVTIPLTYLVKFLLNKFGPSED